MSKQAKRRDRLIAEKVHDTYKLPGSLAEPTRCPQCRAIFHKGRWQWASEAPPNAHEQICSACHRINDNYPAGEVTLSGSFLAQHKDEIIRLARNIESAENEEHPQNRIMAVVDSGTALVLTTSDVHLPRRIGKAVQQAFEGKLEIHFDKAGYFCRVTWERQS